MKKGNVAICIVLLALICLGWISVIGNIRESNSKYNGYLKQAAIYQEKGLYQKEIAAYENALALRESQIIRENWLEAYSLAYEDGVVSSKKYASAMLEMCECYPDYAPYWERLLSFYLNSGNYNSAHDIYKKCIKEEVKSEKLTELANQVLYSYTPTRKVYTEFVRSSYGRFAVFDGAGWGVINFSGEQKVSCDYMYISPHNSSGQVVYVSGKGTRLKSIDGVVESIITDDITKSGAYGSGLLPVYTEESGCCELCG